MFAGQFLSALKMVICGRLTESPLRISQSWGKKNGRFPAKLEQKVGLQNRVLKGVRSSAHKGRGELNLADSVIIC